MCTFGIIFIYGTAQHNIPQSTTSTEDTTTDTDTTTSTEDTKEIHIHNTSLKNIALSLIPEIESLAKDGYTKIVLEDN